MAVRVLIVEDNLDIHELLRHWLTKSTEGEIYELRFVGSLSEAGELFRTVEFDAAVLDLDLPDGEGLHTVIRLAEMAPTLPIVVFTATADDEFATRVIRAGAQDLVVKRGHDAEALRHALDRAIEREQRSRARQAAPKALASTPAADEQDSEAQRGQPLRLRHPSTFDEVAARFADLLEMATDGAIFKTKYELTEHIARMGDTLSLLDASAQDAVEVHIHALRRLGTRPGLDIDVYIKEGQAVLLELMGRLSDSYLARTLKVDRPREVKPVRRR